MKTGGGYYFHEKFDDFLEAVAYQVEKLNLALSEGHGIRCAEIDHVTDYDTRKTWWIVIVRSFDLEPANEIAR